MIVGLAIFLLCLTLFWLVFSDSIIQMWYDYFKGWEERRTHRALIRERKKNPPSCSDCKWCYPSDMSSEFNRCNNPRARYRFCESEREDRLNEVCRSYGILFEEKE